MYQRRERIILRLNAISYRIPMPVTKVVKCSDGFFDSICPRCRGIQPYEYIRYCPLCGQRLYWRFLDDAEELMSVQDLQQKHAKEQFLINFRSLMSASVYDKTNRFRLIRLGISEGGTLM